MYQSQKEMIFNLLESFKNQQQMKCMIESPTGSGKSVCCISAYIGYYNTYIQASNLLRQIDIIIQQKLDYTQESLFQVLINRNLIQYDQDHYNTLFNFIQQYRPLSECINVHKTYITCNINDDKLIPLSLIYCSRTHEQLKQLTKNTLSLFNHGLRISYISSREHSCSNKEVIQEAQRSHQGIQTVCKAYNAENKCKYVSQKTEFISAQDIEDFKQQCSQQSLCSYFCGINNVETSQIIFTPYNYVIDPELQNQVLKGKIKSSIIIFDEAHSLAQFAKNSFSVNFTRDDLIQSEENVDIALDIVQTELNICEMKNTSMKKQLDKLRNKREVFNQFKQYIHQFIINLTNIMMLTDQQNPPNYIHSSLLIFSKIPLKSIRNQIMDYESDVEQTIYQFTRQQLQKGMDQDSPLIKRLKNVKYGSFKKFATLLNIGIYISGDDDNFNSFKILVNKIDIEKNKKKPSFDLACFTPKIAFRILLRLKPASINFISGTLSPMNIIEEQYECIFQIKKQLDHIANLDTQLLCYNVLGIDNKYNFIGTYNNRNEQYFNKVSEAILQITQNLPQGIGCLIFVSSYQILNQFNRLLSLKRKWIQHQNTNILFESKNKNIIEEYQKSILEDKKLTLLLAVQRGQLAEGIDFKDDLCRCIIIVGIPFPDKSSLLFQQQLQWLDEQQKQLNSTQYQMLEAFTAVNQSIGRGIRHKNDYCEIVLLDQRFKNNLEYLPKYIEKRVKLIRLQKFDNKYFDLPYFSQQIIEEQKYVMQNSESSIQDSSSVNDFQYMDQQYIQHQEMKINDDFDKYEFQTLVNQLTNNTQEDIQLVDKYFSQKNMTAVLQSLRNANKFIIISQFKIILQQIGNNKVIISLINQLSQKVDRNKLISLVLAVK